MTVTSFSFILIKCLVPYDTGICGICCQYPTYKSFGKNSGLNIFCIFPVFQTSFQRKREAVRPTAG